MAVAIGTVVAAAVTKGPAHEYLWGLFMGHWGSMSIVHSMVEPGIPRLGVTVFFSLAMAITAFLEWKLRREFNMRAHLSDEGRRTT